MNTPITTRYRFYVGGDSPASVFERLMQEGKCDPYTVLHAVEVAARSFEAHAMDCRAAATSIVCDGDTGFGPLRLAIAMAETFEDQYERTMTALAFLRGDNESEEADRG